MNKVILIGNVGKDPEVSTVTSDNIKVARFSLATQDGKEKTSWHNIVCWRDTADTAQNYVRKGGKVAVEGMIQYREWTGSDGVKKYATDIMCNRLELLSPKADDTAPSKELMDAVKEATPQSKPVQQPLPVSDNDDDLPF